MLLRERGKGGRSTELMGEKLQNATDCLKTDDNCTKEDNHPECRSKGRGTAAIKQTAFRQVRIRRHVQGQEAAHIPVQNACRTGV